MIMILLRHLLRHIRDRLKFLAYRDALPPNPMHDDIYLVEFPKSGVTWLQHILGNIELQLAGRKDEYITFYNHHKYTPDVHQLRKACINRNLRRTFIKSHSEYNPYYYFVIYLIRNPFDVMVSYYNFLLHSGEGFSSFADFIRSDKGISSWKKHVNSWLYRRVDAQRIHFVRYEDLIRDTKTTIRDIYKNLGVVLNDEIIDTALRLSDLESMSQMEEHYRKFNYNYDMYFIGKKNKIKREELLTEEIEKYIFTIAKDEIKIFYPDIYNKLYEKFSQ